MSSVGTWIVWILGIATVLGGVAALVYFSEKWRQSTRWTEKDKEVDSAWWEESVLKKDYEARGCTHFGWSNSDRVAERLGQGSEVVQEVDKFNRIRYRLVNTSGQVLLCRKPT